MKDLTKPYRVLYSGNEIQNEDYLGPQTGHTYPAENLESAEFDTLEEMQDFIKENNLIFILKDETV
jgi:hypothetical protein